METLTILARASTTVSETLCVVRKLHKFMCMIKGGPADLLAILKEVSTLADHLDALESCLALGLIQQNAVDALGSSLEDCARASVELEHILKPFTREVHASHLRWISSFKLTLKRFEVRNCVDRLNLNKQIIMLTLGIVNMYAVEHGNEELNDRLQAGTDSIQAKLAVIAADARGRSRLLQRSDTTKSERSSLFAGMGSEPPIRRLLEDVIPDNHPWAGARDISEIISLNTFSVVSQSRPTSLLTVNPDNFNASAVLNAKTKLQQAIIWGDIRAVMDLTRKGIDLNQAFSSSDTCLHMCARNNDFLMAEVLLWKGASVHIVTRNLQTPLSLALESGNLEMVRVLVDHGAMMRDLLSWMLNLSPRCPDGTKQFAKSCIEHIADNGDENLQEDFVSAVEDLPTESKEILKTLWQELDLPINAEEDFPADESTRLRANVISEMVSYFSASSDTSDSSSQITEINVEQTLGSDRLMSQRNSHLELSASTQHPESSQDTIDDFTEKFPDTPDSDSLEFSYLHDGGQAVVWQLHEVPGRIAALTEQCSPYLVPVSTVESKSPPASELWF